jgi:hypothetical protein
MRSNANRWRYEKTELSLGFTHSYSIHTDTHTHIHTHRHTPNTLHETPHPLCHARIHYALSSSLPLEYTPRSQVNRIFNGYYRLCFRLRAALLYVGFHCLSLHVSAYMAIFRSVGFFIYLFYMLKDSALLHVVKDSENQHTMKLDADRNITCNTHWTIQCSRMLKYSIIDRILPTSTHIHFHTATYAYTCIY